MKKRKHIKNFLIALGMALPAKAAGMEPVTNDVGVVKASQTELPIQQVSNDCYVIADTLSKADSRTDSLKIYENIFLRHRYNNQLLLDTLSTCTDSAQIRILRCQNDSLGLEYLDDKVRSAIDHSLTGKINNLIQTRTVVTDSAMLDLAWRRLCGLEEKMLQFIAHFEDIRARAYYDNKGKKWTYAMGLTVDENGKPLNSNSRIRSVEHLYQVWGQYVRRGESERPQQNKELNNCMFGVMCQALPIAEMTDEQIIASGSFIYNGGSKFLMNLGTKTKSNFSTLMYRYIKTGDEEDMDSLLNLHARFCTASGQPVVALKKRRAVEARCLANDICFVLSEAEKDSLPPEKKEKVLVLNELIIGASYNLALTTIQNPEEYLNKVTEVKGDTVETKIQKQFAVPARPNNNKSTPQRKPQPVIVPLSRYTTRHK